MSQAEIAKSQQLRVFEAVVRRKSFTLAARELKMTQPAVSQHMRSLEDACGVRLVERIGNSILPTPAGSALYPAARHLGRVERDLQAVVSGLRGGARGSLTVGGNTTGGMYLVPRLVRKFKASYPDVEVTLVIADTPNILARIIEREVDVAVVGGPVDPRRFQVSSLCADELIAVAGPGHPILGRGRLGLRDLAQEPLVVPTAGSTTRAFILEKFKEERVHTRISMEFDATESIKKAVEANLGLGIISRWAIEQELAMGALVMLDVEGFPLHREYELVSGRTPQPSPVVDRFRESAQTAGKDIGAPDADGQASAEA